MMLQWCAALDKVFPIQNPSPVYTATLDSRARFESTFILVGFCRLPKKHFKKYSTPYSLAVVLLCAFYSCRWIAQNICLRGFSFEKLFDPINMIFSEYVIM